LTEKVSHGFRLTLDITLILPKIVSPNGVNLHVC